jgi:hypothetical protein
MRPAFKAGLFAFFYVFFSSFFDYLMTARVHLLFFGVSAAATSAAGCPSEDPRMEFIQVLFGSDPEKAPRPEKPDAPDSAIAFRKN